VKKTRLPLIGALVFVAAFAAVSFWFSAAVEKPVRTITSVKSPDGQFKAVRISVSRSGGAPFCFDSVSVILAVYPDGFAERSKSYDVFAAPCARFADGTPSPAIEWLSGTELHITHASEPSKTENADVTKAVHVTFTARE
jgi:hypothetical protein